MGSHALSRRILSLILATSTLITTVLTCINLYLDYRSELGLLENAFHQLERLTLNPLSAAVWSFDDGQIRKFLDGIVLTGDFIEVTVSDIDGSPLYIMQRPLHPGPAAWWETLITEPKVTRRYELNLQQHPEPPRIVGFLTVKASKINIIERLMEKLQVIFIMQGIKTFLISMIILAIFQNYVTRHLVQVAHYLESYRKNGFRSGQTLQLKRSKGKADELDSLVTSLNIVISELDRHHEQNAQRLQATERELETQRISAIQSARLASLGEMAGGIAHEINNPLAIIMASAQRLSRELGRQNLDQVQRCTQQILSTGDRIAQVVNSLRKLSRDGSNTPRSQFRVRQLIDEVMGLCEEKIRRAGINLVVDVSEDVMLNANEVELSQVLFNLLSNACDAVDKQEQPWIHILGLREGDRFTLSVVDSGSGIPPALADRIMEPFFTTKELGKGTGLGLSISLSIAKRHGGDLRLDPASSHTKFDLQLPLRPIQQHA